MIESLESRLARVCETIPTLPQTLKGLILAQPTLDPRQHKEEMPRLKDQNLVPRIIYFFQELGVSFSLTNENLFTAINKHPLKRVYYGLLTEDDKKSATYVHFPAELINSLTDWEKIYFFAGRFCKGDKPLIVTDKRFDEFPVNLDSKQQLYLLVAEYLIAGINILKSKHREVFHYELSPPYEKDVLKDCVDIKRKYLSKSKIDDHGNLKIRARPEQLYFDGWEPSHLNPKTGKRRRYKRRR